MLERVDHATASQPALLNETGVRYDIETRLCEFLHQAESAVRSHHPHSYRAFWTNKKTSRQAGFRSLRCAPSAESSELTQKPLSPARTDQTSHLGIGFSRQEPIGKSRLIKSFHRLRFHSRMDRCGSYCLWAHETHYLV